MSAADDCGSEFVVETQMRSKDVIALFRDASELPDRDRATLAGLLIESLEVDSEPDVEEAWSDEIKLRVADIDAGRVETIPWEEVRRRLLDRLNARQVPSRAAAEVERAQAVRRAQRSCGCWIPAT